jgi:glucose/arabinose dehydrogenase
VANVPAVLLSQHGGMLGVYMSPKYDTDRSVYLTYSEPGDSGSSLALARARFATADTPQWNGSLLIGGLVTRSLSRVLLDKKGGATPAERWKVGFQVRDVAVAPDGAVRLIENSGLVACTESPRSSPANRVSSPGPRLRRPRSLN